VTAPHRTLSWDHALTRLEAADRRLALAAGVVDLLHPDATQIAEDILCFLAWRYPDADPVAEYIRRAEALAALQERFDREPSVATLSGPAELVPRDRYNIGLLLSIVFTNHRFEIMQQLYAFLANCTEPAGRIASVGTGTGYELRLMARTLQPGWTIESYDTDETVRTDAQHYLEFFGVKRPVIWGNQFPLDEVRTDFRGKYSAIVLCEVLEHLPNPPQSLCSVRECLTPGGRAFVTMAVNIAQEDHIFLYPDVDSCRIQLREAGLKIVSEWVTPQTTLPPPADREAVLRKGNYVAVAVSASSG
jgi:2-polyprenyl-3-methyl-5-hydroxy-6-metoxy-1,4-benzoquinol methylase